METVEGSNTFYAKSRSDWRKWLTKHCETERRVWLVLYHKGAATPSVHLQEAIEEAICFGWIDSKGKKRSSDSFYLCFNKRNPKSPWGRRSRERAEQMIQEGRMTVHGQATIDFARRTGTWEAHAEAQNTIVPKDLREQLDSNPLARDTFDTFAPSSKRIVLEWISKAKKTETRQRRISQAVALAAINQIAGLPKGLRESRSRRSKKSRN